MRYLAGLLLFLGFVTPAIAQTETQRAAPDYQPKVKAQPSDAGLKAILSRPVDPKPQVRPVIVPARPGTTAWRMTRRNGDVYLIGRFVEEGKFFIIHDLSGVKSSHLIESVAKIEPLTDEELTAARSNYIHPANRPVESSARTTARVAARTTARTTTRDSEVDDGVASSSALSPTYSYGSTPSSRGSSSRGSGYYTGPRQSSGHYAGGVGSSHKGGHYTNPNTGNHYQKRK